MQNGLKEIFRSVAMAGAHRNNDSPVAPPAAVAGPSGSNINKAAFRNTLLIDIDDDDGDVDSSGSPRSLASSNGTYSHREKLRAERESMAARIAFWDEMDDSARARRLLVVASSSGSQDKGKSKAAVRFGDDEIIVSNAPSGSKALILDGKDDANGNGNRRASGWTVDLSFDDDSDVELDGSGLRRHVQPGNVRNAGIDEDEVLILDQLNPNHAQRPALEAAAILPATPIVAVVATPVPTVATPSVDDSLRAILDILPDASPAYVLSLLVRHGRMELVLDLLFSSDYPKVAKQSASKPQPSALKRARSDEDDAAARKEAKAKMYTEIQGRPPSSVEYRAASLEYFFHCFDMMPARFITTAFSTREHFLVPTLEYLIAQRDGPDHKYRHLGTKRSNKGKGKAATSVEFERELQWFNHQASQKRAATAKAKIDEEKMKADSAAGLLVECECCMTEFSSEDMIQCVDAHLFCRECSVGNANTEIGKRQCDISCPSGEGCLIPESQLLRFLPESSIAALHKTRMEKEIDEAQILGLSKCPFCSYACAIENDQERLFTCMREGCEVVSCRQCKKVDHLPQTCEEVSNDAKVKSIHGIEEAMTTALIRKCPKCDEPYVKEMGCNKVTCPSCHTFSCFVCGKIVLGYSHFTGAGTNASIIDKGAHCPLWDDSAARTFAEVEAARVKASADAARINPAVRAEDLKKLHLPPPPPPDLHIAPHFPVAQVGDLAGQARARAEQHARDVLLQERRLVLLAEEKRKNLERSAALKKRNEEALARQREVKDAREKQRARLLG